MILYVSVKCETVCRMHSPILGTTGCLRSAQEHARVSQSTWRVYLEVVPIGGAHNTGILPIDFLLVLGSLIHHLVTRGVINAIPITTTVHSLRILSLVHGRAMDCGDG